MRIIILMFALMFALGALSSKLCFAFEILPFIVNNQDYRTNVGINNRSTNEAEVILALFNNKGTKVAESSVTLPAFGFYQMSGIIPFFFGDRYVDSFEGYLTLQSVAEISAFASQINVRTNDPWIIQSSQPAVNHILIPFVTSLVPYRTAIAIINLGTETSDIELKLRNHDGLLLALAYKKVHSRDQFTSLDIFGEMGVEGHKGSLEIRSLNLSPLAVISRVSHTSNQMSGFLPSTNLNSIPETFYLPYILEPEIQNTLIILTNPNDVEASVKLQSFNPSGILAGEYSTIIAPHGITELSPEHLFRTDREKISSGILRVISNRSIAGLTSNNNNRTGDLSFGSFTTEGATELLLPALTQVPSFLSTLLLANLGDSSTVVQLVARDIQGRPVGADLRLFLPSKGSSNLQEILRDLSLSGAFFGPLEIRSLYGQPIYASSQVISLVSTGRGVLEAIDITPTFARKQGDLLKLRWKYDPLRLPGIAEFRIYQVEQRGQKYQLIGTVHGTDLEFGLEAKMAGKFIFVVTAFNGQSESRASNEVVVNIEPPS